jgi:signal transduction histidine kinase
MQRVLRSKHPFPLLLYLEWILLGIALLMAFSTPFPIGHRRPRVWQAFDQLGGMEPFPLGVLLCIVAIGILGLRLPIQQARMGKIVFTASNLGLSWLAAFFGAQGSNSFSALLLVVVIRSSLLFPWRERFFVALLAFGSFILKLLLGIRYFYALGILPPERLRPMPLGNRFSPEQVQSAIFNLTLNSTLLFGLVLVFVLLMVGAILTERQSRDNLALANDRLRRYALLVENQATLQERNRIAREIHDSVGHALTAQSIQLENVAMWLDDNRPRACDHLQKARNLGKEALQNVRQSVATLRQSPLQEKSLPDALKLLVQDFERTTGIQTQIQVQYTQSLPTEVAIALYRITQEAMTNIAKHSQATQVSLNLQANSKALEFSLEDNGQGFTPALNTTGFGLQSMRERTEALGGIFEITSQPSQGCRIHVTFPQSGGNL